MEGIEGKGRSGKLPRKRLNFENIPTVVVLLSFSAHMYHCFPLTGYSDLPKIAGREKIVSASVVGCFPAVINSRKAEGAVFFH